MKRILHEKSLKPYGIGQSNTIKNAIKRKSSSITTKLSIVKNGGLESIFFLELID